MPLAESAPSTAAINLSRYASIVLRQWRLVLAAGLVGALVAGAYLLFIGQGHTAQTDLNINVISTDPFNAQRSASGLLDATTEAQLATSFAVAGIAAEEIDVDPVELRRSTEASVVPDATVIRIRYTASSPEKAIAGADAVAVAYLAYRSAQADDRLDGILASVTERIDALRTTLADANARLAVEPVGSTAHSQALSDRDLVTIELNNLLSLKTAAETIDTSGGSVLSSASENEVIPTPGRFALLATAGLTGLALGILAAFAVSAIRSRVTGPEEAAAETGESVLGSLSGAAGELPATGRDLDEIRTIRERILTAIDPQGRILVVADDTAGSLPSEVPITLALSFAETGLDVRIVLPQLAQPLVRHLRSALRFSASRGKGSDPTALTSTRYPGVRIVLPRDDRSGQVLTAGVRALLADRGDGELTVVILPPDRDDASVLAAAREADGVISILESGATRRDRARNTVLAAQLADTRYLGAVLVGRRRRVVLAEAESASDSRGAADRDAKAPEPAG